MLFSIFQEKQGLGTCDGTFGNKQYFNCAPKSAVFVGLDKLEPLEDNSCEATLDSVIPSQVFHLFSNGRSNTGHGSGQVCGLNYIAINPQRVN